MHSSLDEHLYEINYMYQLLLFFYDKLKMSEDDFVCTPPEIRD
jgi:hypothetical protein